MAKNNVRGHGNLPRPTRLKPTTRLVMLVMTRLLKTMNQTMMLLLGPKKPKPPKKPKRQKEPIGKLDKSQMTNVIACQVRMGKRIQPLIKYGLTSLAGGRWISG